MQVAGLVVVRSGKKESKIRGHLSICDWARWINTCKTHCCRKHKRKSMNNVEGRELNFGHTENKISDRELHFGCAREGSLVQILSK